MKRKATTLIEVMLYTVIAGFFVTTITIFAWSAIATKNRSDSQIAVNDASQIAMEDIEKTIRNANNISAPSTKGETTNSLTLNSIDGSVKTYSLESSRIKLSTASDSFFITPEGTVINEMTFTNVSRLGSPGAINIHIKISRKNPENITELSAINEINTTVSLRN